MGIAFSRISQNLKTSLLSGYAIDNKCSGDICQFNGLFRILCRHCLGTMIVCLETMYVLWLSCSHDNVPGIMPSKNLTSRRGQIFGATS